MPSYKRLAVLGLGSIGLRHARNALALGRAVVGFDPDPARRAALEREGGVAAASAEAALSGAWAAVVASPSARHLSDVAACIGNDLHVLAEKPLAHVVDGVEALLAEAERKGLVVAAAFNLRHRAVVAAARRELAAERLGRPVWARFLSGSYLPSWRPGQDYRQGYANDPVAGGVLFDVIHEFDLANHLLGPARPLAAASRRSGLLELDSEDVADVLLEHDGGHRSALHLDYLTRPRRRQLEICGSGGLLAADLVARRLTVWNVDGEAVLQQDVPGELNDEYVAEMADFLEAAETGRPPACGGREALAVLRQVCEARAICGLPSTDGGARTA